MHDDYDAIDALRWSRLSLMNESPLAYHTQPRVETRSMRLGTLAHALVLDMITHADVRVWSGRRAGKAYDEFAAAAAADGLPCVTASEWGAANEIAVGVHRHRLAREIIARTDHEVTVTWSESGRAHKARVDMLGRERAEVWDLKTSRNPRPQPFGVAVARYLYHGQLAHYTAGAVAFRGWPEIEQCGFIVVGSAPPHDVLVAPMLREDLGLGAALRDDLLRRLDECEASGLWPGAYPEPVHVTMPGWAYTGDDTSSEEESEDE